MRHSNRSIGCAPTLGTPGACGGRTPWGSVPPWGICLTDLPHKAETLPLCLARRAPRCPTARGRYIKVRRAEKHETLFRYSVFFNTPPLLPEPVRVCDRAYLTWRISPGAWFALYKKPGLV